VQTDFVKAGLGAGIVKLQTSKSVATEDLWCDMPVVPIGYVRLIQAISLTPNSNLSAGESVSAFVCDQTMSPNNSPLLASGRLDFTKVGAFVGLATVAFGSASSFPLGQNCEMLILAPGQFLRFATASVSAPFPAIGDFANVSVFYSDISICEC
jgi:hypothetical protein